MNRRLQRVADQLREDLARFLHEEVRDPEIGFVTLTGVEVSPDLRHARVFVALLEDEERGLAALRRATPFLRHTLAQKSRLRVVPELRFVVDRSAAVGSRVEELLNRLDRPRDDGSSEGEG